MRIDREREYRSLEYVRLELLAPNSHHHRGVPLGVSYQVDLWRFPIDSGIPFARWLAATLPEDSGRGKLGYVPTFSPGFRERF